MSVTKVRNKPGHRIRGTNYKAAGVGLCQQKLMSQQKGRRLNTWDEKKMAQAIAEANEGDNISYVS